MVFACHRPCCFSQSFQEEEEIEYETTTQAKSTSTQTFYTASSDLNRDFQVTELVLSNLVNLRVFTFAQLKAATKNFDKASIIGEGGLGFVYRGVIKSLVHPFHDIQVVVKYASGVLQGLREWLYEVSLVGAIEHPNLVKLVGYCAEDNEKETQRLLVYEYMPNRSLWDHLSTSSQTPLPWMVRLKVAQDVACGLAYLHEEMDFQIRFGDFKSSNILLDDQWNAKLSDFGFTRLDPQAGRNHVTTVAVGTMGIVAPEFMATGGLTAKSDVWSYGVFLYELITGKRPLDRNRPKNEKKLLEWVKPHLDSKNFGVIIDPRLEGNYSLESAQKLSFIANKCLSKDPNSRPKMSEVLGMVNQVIMVPTNAASPPKSLIRVAGIKLKKVLMCTTCIRSTK